MAVEEFACPVREGRPAKPTEGTGHRGGFPLALSALLSPHP